MTLDRVPIKCPRCERQNFVMPFELRFGGSVECGENTDNGEGCRKYFEPTLEQKVEAVLQWLDEL